MTAQIRHSGQQSSVSTLRLLGHFIKRRHTVSWFTETPSSDAGAARHDDKGLRCLRNIGCNGKKTKGHRNSQVRLQTTADGNGKGSILIQAWDTPEDLIQASDRLFGTGSVFSAAAVRVQF